MAILPATLLLVPSIAICFACLLCSALVGLVWYYFSRHPTSKYPPGPKPHWLLGNVEHFLDAEPTAAAERLRLDYGNLTTLRIGLKKIVIVNDYETMRRLFLDDAVSGRPQLRLFREFNFGDNGILFVHGDKWREQRRFALSTLRTLGFGKSRIQNLILEEIDDLCDRFRREAVKNADGVFDPQEPLLFATASIIAAFLYGTRRYSGDERFRSVVKKVNTNGEFGSEPEFGAIIVFPLLAYIPFTRFRRLYKKMWRDSIEFYQLLNEQVKWRADEIANSSKTETLCSASDVAVNSSNRTEHDLVEAFMQRRMQLQQQSATTTLSCNNASAASALQYYTDMQAVILSKDLLIAGMDTSANTLSWLVQLMINFPDCQARVAQEIHTHLGSDGRRQVTIEDRRHLLYTDAVVHEVMRFRTLAPHGVPHMTLSAIDVDGYTLPKGTEIWPNLWAVHHDERLWPAPHAFDPEKNFLERDDETGEMKLRLPKWFVAFSTGKRACLGESLARMELFMIFANLINVFRFEKPPPNTEIDGAGPFPNEFEMRNNGLMWSPRKYNVRLVERYTCDKNY